MPKKKKPPYKYPDVVCYECARKAGIKRDENYIVACYYRGICDVCKEIKSVTEPRDYGYPDFEAYKKYVIKHSKDLTKYGFTECPKCGTKHTSSGFHCRECGFRNDGWWEYHVKD